MTENVLEVAGNAELCKAFSVIPVPVAVIPNKRVLDKLASI